MYRFRCSLLVLTLSVAARTFAVTYVFPKDRFEIERSSAIIAGRVLSSHVERTPRFGIETITDVAVEEAIKGNPGATIEIHEPRGSLGGEARLIPGVPGFTDGDRVLLFLHQRENGDYTVNDLQLGSFRFENDVMIRDESELVGWDLDGTPHKERPRSAGKFIEYIRVIVRGETAVEDYFVSTSAPSVAANAMNVKSDAIFTASSYLAALVGSLGVRWNVFPSAVNWNKGNSEVGVLGNGTSQINNAFSVWNGGGAHYVLASSNANANGIMDAVDGVNNIVFEKNLTAFGIQPYSCTAGGVLGMGGIHNVIGTHSFSGETFATTKEADVSMNQGLGACTLAQLPTSEFNTTVAHELGHTLGFRHSDQNRTQNAPCSSDPALDCSNSAIMEHLLIVGLNGKLQTWDTSAVTTVYGNGPACTPPSIASQPGGATITSGTSAQLSVSATGTPPLTYQWFVGSSGNTSLPVSGGTTATISVGPLATTSYWVRVTGPCPPSADSSSATVTVNPCPTVVLGTPRATQVDGGFLLSIDASGGGLTYQWFEGAVSGAGTPAGTGNSLLVNPRQTTSYWCRVTNNCNNKAESRVVTVELVPVVVNPARRRAVGHS